MYWMDDQSDKITNCFLPQLVDQIFDNFQKEAAIAAPTKGTLNKHIHLTY